METTLQVNLKVSRLKEEAGEALLMELFRQTIALPCFVCNGKSFFFALAPDNDPSYNDKPFALPTCRECMELPAFFDREIMQVALSDANEPQPIVDNTPIMSKMDLEFQEACDQLLADGTIFIKGYNENGEAIYAHKDFKGN